MQEQQKNGSVIADSDLRHALSVLEVACTLAPDDPPRVLLERASVQLVKSAKKKRRAARKRARRAEDVARLERTGLRRGVGLASSEQVVEQQPAERLHRQRHCYVCKAPYRQLHTFYDRLCPDCAERHFARRQGRADLSGRRAIITGGRIKIGYHLALKMLRDGAHVTITTRFPRDAARRFRTVTDYDQWKDKLSIYGLDLRDLRSVLAFCDQQLACGPFDILVNNAAQSIRRPPAYYRTLAEAELAPLTDTSQTLDLISQESALSASTNRLFYDLCVNAPADKHFPVGELDIEGKPLDLRQKTSWHLRLHEIEPVEMAEVWLVNTMAPFLLATHLKPAMLRSPFLDRYIVNVSASEGRFDYPQKTSNHAHGNMAKAALNMMTRTASADYAQDGIYMTSVDPGWITDQNPESMRQRLRQRGFHPPLDVIDAAARVYDPIVRGIEGERLYGVFLKDYEICSW